MNLRWESYREEDGAGARLLMNKMPIAAVQIGANLNTYHLFFFDRHRSIAATDIEVAKREVEKELGIAVEQPTKGVEDGKG